MEYIYLDHNATTPIDPEVKRAILSFMENGFGNPSCTYPLGREASESLERARKSVASLIRAKPEEVMFTSCGTESNNMVIKGAVDLKNPSKYHIITSAIEHPSVLSPAIYLQELGVRVTVVPVDGYGLVDPDDVKKAIRRNTTLISIMLANNETGTIEPIEEISKIARDHGVPLHTDASQAVGKVPVNVNELGVDFLTIAGHKLYAPKGIGALYIRSGIKISPLIHGGGQERGLRSGTENTLLAIGLGTACEVVKRRLREDMETQRQMRNQLERALFQEIEGLVLCGHPERRLPNTLNICIPGIEGAKILERIPEIYASTGSACHEKDVKLSHVLSAMGIPHQVGMGALRFSLGRLNTPSQIEKASKLIIDAIKDLK